MTRTYKKIEVIGTSEGSIEEAIDEAVRSAAETIKGLSWFEVKEMRGRISEGRVSEYQVTVDLGFRLLRDD